MKVAQSIFRNNRVLFAYQFGSTVDGTANKKSDIDIAVFLDKRLNKKQRFEKRLKLISELTKIYKKDVDVVVLNDISSLFFKYIIMKEGKRIYETQKEEYVDYECRTMSLYFDYQPFLEVYNKEYVKKHAQ